MVAEKKKKEVKDEKKCYMMSMTRKGKICVTKTCLAIELHSLNYIGIDTCSALSVSTQVGDFINLDTSQAAKDSVSIRGVGGIDSTVGGRGILIVKTVDWQGKDVWVIDPEGVYIESGAEDPAFRVLGREQWRKNGLRVIEGGSPGDHDILQDIVSGKGVSLTDCNRILAMETLTVSEAGKEAAFVFARKVSEGCQSGMIWDMVTTKSTTTEPYYHRDEGENHTPNYTNTMLTQEYSNGFWN